MILPSLSQLRLERRPGARACSTGPPVEPPGPPGPPEPPEPPEPGALPKDDEEDDEEDDEKLARGRIRLLKNDPRRETHIEQENVLKAAIKASYPISNVDLEMDAMFGLYQSWTWADEDPMPQSDLVGPVFPEAVFMFDYWERKSLRDFLHWDAVLKKMQESIRDKATYDLWARGLGIPKCYIWAFVTACFEMVNASQQSVKHWTWDQAYHTVEYYAHQILKDAAEYQQLVRDFAALQV